VTLSLAAHLDGAFGLVISSSSPAVASRCSHLRAGVGAVASQNVTNPALGSAVLDLLAKERTPDAAVADALSADPFAAYRQVTAVDRHGRVAVHSGPLALGIHGAQTGDGCVAAGNLLASDAVLNEMVIAFTTAAGTLEERLMTALEAAAAAGGEAGPLRSAGLAVVEGASWRVSDLRVDDHDDPVRELRRLLSLWMPQKNDYLTRAVAPASAPSYGVPGDE
jgi:uncharacterized Ntn-hydrolase superfamily protein